MQLRINGEKREVTDNLSLQELVIQLQLKPEQIAVELNHTVVRRNEWAATMLGDGDSIEIVHFVGGGGAVGRRQANGRSSKIASGRGFCFLRLTV